MNNLVNDLLVNIKPKYYKVLSNDSFIIYDSFFDFKGHIVTITSYYGENKEFYIGITSLNKNKGYGFSLVDKLEKLYPTFDIFINGKLIINKTIPTLGLY